MSMYCTSCTRVAVYLSIGSPHVSGRLARAGPLCASLCGLGPGASALSLSACRRRKARTVFTDQQLSGLEKRFESQRYLSTPERLELAAQLCLSETQIKARAASCARARAPLDACAREPSGCF